MGRICIKKLTEKLKVLLLLTPFLVLVTGILFLGIVDMVNQSFGYIPQLNIKEFTLSYYKEVLLDKNFYFALKYTLYLGIVPTIFSVFFGTIFAIQVFYRNGKNNKINMSLQVPIIIPYTVYAFFVIMFFMQTGIVSRILNFFHIINTPSEFPLLIYDDYGIGILIVYFLKQVPFVYFLVSSALAKVDVKILQASYNLGGTKMQTIFRVIIPMIKSSIITSTLLCFAFNFGSFEVPYILANPKNDTLPILAYKKYISTNLANRPYSMVINTLIFIICCIILSRYLVYTSKANFKSKE